MVMDIAESLSASHIVEMRFAAFLIAYLALANTAIAEGQNFHSLDRIGWIKGNWPIGFMYYCKDRPDQCLPVATEPAPVDYLLWESRLDDINRQVNASIEYRHEIGDHWSDSPAFGDCDDYALTKRNMLLELGFDRANVLFAFVLLSGSKEMHTTLVVRTQYGLKVMDSLSSEVYSFDQMMVDWAWVQDPLDPRIWLPVD